MTQAEQCVADWRAITDRTVSLSKMARDRGAKFKQMWDHKSFTFEDGTVIEVRGTGKNHQVNVTNDANAVLSSAWQPITRDEFNTLDGGRK